MYFFFCIKISRSYEYSNVTIFLKYHVRSYKDMKSFYTIIMIGWFAAHTREYTFWNMQRKMCWTALLIMLFMVTYHDNLKTVACWTPFFILCWETPHFKLLLFDYDNNEISQLLAWKIAEYVCHVVPFWGFEFDHKTSRTSHDSSCINYTARKRYVVAINFFVKKCKRILKSNDILSLLPLISHIPVATFTNMV